MASNERNTERQRQVDGGRYTHFPILGMAGKRVINLTGRRGGLRPASSPCPGRGLLAFARERGRGLTPTSFPYVGNARALSQLRERVEVGRARTLPCQQTPKTPQRPPHRGRTHFQAPRTPHNNPIVFQDTKLSKETSPAPTYKHLNKTLLKTPQFPHHHHTNPSLYPTNHKTWIQTTHQSLQKTLMGLSLRRHHLL